MGYEGHHPQENGRGRGWSESEGRMRDRDRGGRDWGRDWDRERGGNRGRWDDRNEQSRRYDERWDPRDDARARQSRPPRMRNSPRTMIEVESEKEFVDLIVDCVSEQVERIVQREMRHAFTTLLEEIRDKR